MTRPANGSQTVSSSLMQSRRSGGWRQGKSLERLRRPRDFRSPFTEVPGTEYLVLGPETVNGLRICPLRLGLRPIHLPQIRFAQEGGNVSLSSRGMTRWLLVLDFPKLASLKREETGSCFSPRERSECWGEYRRRRGRGSSPEYLVLGSEADKRTSGQPVNGQRSTVNG